MIKITKILLISLLPILIGGCQPQTPEMGSRATGRKWPLEGNRYNVAFLIMDGVYNTELTAPYDIFQHSIKAMNTFMVADTREPMTTFEGMRILPDFNYLSNF